MGLGAALDGSGKSRLHRGSDPWTIQVVANRYTSSDRAGEPFSEHAQTIYKFRRNPFACPRKF